MGASSLNRKAWSLAALGQHQPKLMTQGERLFLLYLQYRKDPSWSSLGYLLIFRQIIAVRSTNLSSPESLLWLARLPEGRRILNKPTKWIMSERQSSTDKMVTINKRKNLSKSKRRKTVCIGEWTILVKHNRKEWRVGWGSDRCAFFSSYEVSSMFSKTQYLLHIHVVEIDPGPSPQLHLQSSFHFYFETDSC